MDVDNDTSTPVNYDQSGSGPGQELPEQAQANPPCPQTGRLEEKGSGNNSARFVPGCRPPWTVRFQDDEGNEATSRPIQAREINATVTLNADWTVTVSDNS